MNAKDALEQVVYNLTENDQTLKNGARLVCAAERNHEEESHYVIGLWRKGKRNEYVVWTMLADGECIWGHYFDALADAIGYFVERTKNLVTERQEA